ncbi:protein-L-isoaspartate(D-aspartate) O-methyltransferase [Candidatus Woesearchaeota archaeon]|nr:protein-L-isoaspartate(D-aspartate) O-methyltransferase [Candidatus Woesearchaeota archaeon]
MNYSKLREDMVKHQIESRGVSDKRVLKAMREVPRELFVPEGLVVEAYNDHPLPIGHGQTISQPYIVAEMTELLELKGSEKVLEIGTGSGYQAAILSKLAKKVITLERIEGLAKKTRVLLKKHGYNNVTVIHGDGTKGYGKEAPYDAIIVTAAADKIPKALIEQLAEGGRLVAPVGKGYGQELLRIIKREGDKLDTEEHGGVIFVPLIGDE